MENPVKYENAHGETDSAVVFVHGFTGDGVKTWGTFPEILQNDPDLATASSTCSVDPSETPRPC